MKYMYGLKNKTSYKISTNITTSPPSNRVKRYKARKYHKVQNYKASWSQEVKTI